MSIDFKTKLTPKWRKWQVVQILGIRYVIIALYEAMICFIYYPKNSDVTKSTPSLCTSFANIKTVLAMS